MENLQESNGNNSAEYPLQTNNTFLLEPTLESELKKLLENKNKSRDLKLDKISFISKNIQSIGNDVPLIFCNITSMNARDAEAFRGLGGRGVQLDERLAAVVGQHLDLEIAGDKITIGISHKNQIILEDKMVSSFHAVIKCDKNWKISH